MGTHGAPNFSRGYIMSPTLYVHTAAVLNEGTATSGRGGDTPPSLRPAPVNTPLLTEWVKWFRLVAGGRTLRACHGLVEINPLTFQIQTTLELSHRVSTNFHTTGIY